MKQSIDFGYLALTRIDKASHLSIHRRVLGIVSESIAQHPLPGLPASLMDEWAEAVRRLVDILAHSSRSIHTARMREADALRNNLFTYIYKTIAATKKSPVKRRNEAAQELGLVMGSCSSVQRLGQDKKTVAIDGILYDLRKERFAESVHVLDLGPDLDELARQNLLFKELKDMRSDERRHQEPVVAKPVRRKADACLQRVLFLLEAIYLMNDDAQLMAQIKDIAQRVNFMIGEAIEKYNQVQAQRYGAGKNRIGSNAARRKALQKAARYEASKAKTKDEKK